MGLFSPLVCPVHPHWGQGLSWLQPSHSLPPWTPRLHHFSSNRAVSVDPVSSQSPSWEQSSLNSTHRTFLTQENTSPSTKLNSGRLILGSHWANKRLNPLGEVRPQGLCHQDSPSSLNPFLWCFPILILPRGCFKVWFLQSQETHILVTASVENENNKS